ncbi:MAG: MFS transporter [Lactobacillales bacterium]|nr:MFS transporter [Lactobacillales bacterium]
MKETPSTSHSIFTRDFFDIALVNFLVMLNFYSMLVTVGPYAVDTFHASSASAGLVAGITVIGSLLARLSSGYLTNKFETKHLLLFGLILMLPVMASYLVTPSVTVLLIIRFLNGIAIGLIGTVTNTAVILLFPPDRRSEGISYFSLSTILATAIGPFFGLLLTQLVSYKILFLVEIAISILALIFATMIHGDTIKFKTVHHEGQKLSIRHFVEPKVFGLAFVVLVVGLTYASLQSNLALFMKSIGLEQISSYFFLFYAAIIFVSRPFTGRIMDSKNENYIAYPSLVLLAIGLFVLSNMHHAWVMPIAAILIGAGFGNFQSTTQSAIANFVEPHRLGQANSTYFIFFDIALGFGPYLLGIIEPFLGYRHLFLAMSGVAVVSIFLYYWAHGKSVTASEKIK